MDTKELKLRARSFMDKAKPSPVTVGLAYLALALVVGYLSAKIMGTGMSEQDMAQYMEHVANGNYEYAVEYLERIRPPFTAYSVEALLNIVISVIGIGYTIFLLNTIRNNGACFGNLLDGFGFLWKIILLNILKGLFIALWTLAFIVPGIIAAYRYRMANYIMIDHPEYSAMECIRESKKMMSGRKRELFRLDISFIGWYLLTVIPGIGWLAQVWTTPYFGLTYAQYYEMLRFTQAETYGGSVSEFL